MKLSTLTEEQYAELSAKVLAMQADHVSLARIGAELGLNHTQVDAITYRARITDADREAWANSGSTMGERAAAGREAGLSWGWMGYVADVPESQIRRAFADHTQNKSQGQRIGKGGRFYYREGVLYEDVLKPTGTVIPVDVRTREGAIALSKGQRFVKLGIEGQERIGAAAGIPRIKGQSLTAWQAKVIAALEGKDEAPATVRKPRSKKVAAAKAEATTVQAEVEATA